MTGSCCSALGPTFSPLRACSQGLVDQLSLASGSAEGARLLFTKNCITCHTATPCCHRPPDSAHPSPLTATQAQLWGHTKPRKGPGQSLEPRISSGILAQLLLHASGNLPSAQASLPKTALQADRRSEKAQGFPESKVLALTFKEQRPLTRHWESSHGEGERQEPYTKCTGSQPQAHVANDISSIQEL